MESHRPGKKGPRRAARCRRCSPTSCWMIWTRNWNGGATASAGVLGQSRRHPSVPLQPGKLLQAGAATRAQQTTARDDQEGVGIQNRQIADPSAGGLMDPIHRLPASGTTHGSGRNRDQFDEDPSVGIQSEDDNGSLLRLELVGEPLQVSQKLPLLLQLPGFPG